MNDESVLANYLDEHYEQNPLDESYEGRLARISGLSKEEVIETLAIMDYLEYLDNYHPENRIALGEPKYEKQIYINSYKKSAAPENYINLHEIAYQDIRNRVVMV